ncbi:hypothetical protein MOMA_01755 [Moraxella macacae 0408225]|uniref:Uncharacterized protein n=1 Tax=Moraxella macacae 0408225 TaxID=1230338 RepID=L2F7U5_9GAMM|nr:tetratricopeptide repeat protein [Moraxella macacae]ELA09092.1 hypothetical protein MOMA_01755 [Moraxella macacae 0408225]
MADFLLHSDVVFFAKMPVKNSVLVTKKAPVKKPIKQQPVQQLSQTKQSKQALRTIGRLSVVVMLCVSMPFVALNKSFAENIIYQKHLDNQLVLTIYQRLQESDFSKFPQKSFVKKTKPTSMLDALLSQYKPTQASNQPSLLAVIMAEFSANRQDVSTALQLYKHESQKEISAPVFERALSLSLEHELAPVSLRFANRWQQVNPEHIPALFYVTHLALKAHKYELAGEKLNQILKHDPNADLSQILVGIYPTDTTDQAQLLNILQNLDTKNNPSLLVMKAGLLLQFNQSSQALSEIDKALAKQPKNPAFLILKADILQAIPSMNDTPKVDNVNKFITKARKTLPDNKSLFLYQTRYLIKQGKNDVAWQLLNDKKNVLFLADDEIKLLAGLVGVDSERYQEADNLLLALTQSLGYKDRAYYYLGVSAERQLNFGRAIEFYGRVMQPDLVLTARKRQVDLLVSERRYDDASASMQRLREQFDEFIPQSYIMQATVLKQANKLPQAIALLNEAQRQLPDNMDILFAKVLLMPYSTADEQAKRLDVLQTLRRLDPNNVEYRLEYAQTLVNLKQNPTEVENLITPLVNDTQVGLKVRQILAQQALHQADNARIVVLLSDNFDIIPDVISGLLLQQAYTNLGNTNEALRIENVLKTELHYPPMPQNY